jgi:hypothetical protein
MYNRAQVMLEGISNEIITGDKPHLFKRRWNDHEWVCVGRSGFATAVTREEAYRVWRDAIYAKRRTAVLQKWLMRKQAFAQAARQKAALLKEEERRLRLEAKNEAERLAAAQAQQRLADENARRQTKVKTRSIVPPAAVIAPKRKVSEQSRASWQYEGVRGPSAGDWLLGDIMEIPRRDESGFVHYVPWTQCVNEQVEQ